MRHELAASGGTIRTTTILPGAVDTPLSEGSSHAESAKAVKEFYEIAIPADAVARAIAYAIEQPDDVSINEIVLRPTAQAF
ncbi:short chain dehydrogenase [compost metagenome]